MIQIPCGSQRCATCQYWMGIRTVSGSTVKVESSENSKCAKSGNANYGKDKNAMTDCSGWKRV